MEEKQENYLSPEETWNFAQLAQVINNLYPSVFTPQLINSRMIDTTLLSVGQDALTESSILRALQNPKGSEKQLLGISEALEYSNTSYKRILQYMANLPAWDLTYYCKNIKDPNEYKSPKYKKDLNVVKDWLDKFDYKREFATVVKQMFREETFFSILRDESNSKYTLQQLPSNYCLITGRWEYSPVLFSFDYTWLFQGGIDINMYPPIMKETYARLWLNTGQTRQYVPSIDVNERSQSTWVLYGDCSPADGFWGWKLSPELTARIPYFAGLFPSLSIFNLVRSIQKNNYLASQAKIILGEVETLNKEAKATVKNDLSLSPDLLGRFLQLIKSTIADDSVRVAAAPFQNFTSVDFKSDNTILSSYSRDTLGLSGVNSNLLFSGDVKPNQIETILSANVDELVSMSIYPFFNSFLEWHINRKTGYYKFGFNFEGSNFYLDRQRRLEAQTSLIPFGIVNPQKLAASLGQSPFVFQAQLDEARINGWVDNLTPIISSFNSPSGGKEAGAPKKSDSKISESGEQTRQDGGNLNRGGKPE